MPIEFVFIGLLGSDMHMYASCRVDYKVFGLGVALLGVGFQARR